MSIHTYGDLLEQDAESSRWTDTGLLGLNHLDQLLETRLPEHRPITLRPGTCWTVADGSVLEYIGKLAVAEGPELMFKRWTSTAGQRIGSTLRLAEDSAPLGAGTELLLRYEDVWPNTTATRAILSSDASRPRGTKGIERTLVREFTQLAPSLDTAPPKVRTRAEDIVEWLRDNGLEEGAYEIFTDGSWKDHTPWLQRLFHGSNPGDTVAAAAVVCLHVGEDRWTKPGLLTHIGPSTGLELTSGYPAELSALLCASQVALLWKPAAIITDCESAVNMIKKGFIPRAEQKLNHATLARLLVRYSRKLKPVLYRHTYAHLDQYLPPNLHTPDQRAGTSLQIALQARLKNMRIRSRSTILS
jgi:hypothetical protein